MSDLLLNAPLQYELLKQNRFLFRFPSDLGIQEWWVSTASRPKINITKTPVPFLNTETYTTGRYTWQAMQVVLKDPIGPSASQAVMEWVRLHAESLSGRMGYAAGYMRDIEIEMLDPTGVSVSKWLLKNCMLSDTIDFGNLNYSTDSLAEITLNIQPMFCLLLY